MTDAIAVRALETLVSLWYDQHGYNVTDIQIGAGNEEKTA